MAVIVRDSQDSQDRIWGYQGRRLSRAQGNPSTPLLPSPFRPPWHRLEPGTGVPSFLPDRQQPALDESKSSGTRLRPWLPVAVPINSATHIDAIETSEEAIEVDARYTPREGSADYGNRHG